MSDLIRIPSYLYKTIPVQFLHDERISAKARGVMSTIYSLPDNWDFSVQGLVAILPDGKSLVRNSILELEKYGYIERERVRDESGRLGATIYNLIPEPDNGFAHNQPKFENRMLARSVQKQENLPHTENRMLVKSVQNVKKQIQKQGILPKSEKPTLENRTQCKYINNNSSIERKTDRQTRTHEMIQHSINYNNLSRNINFADQDILEAIVDVMFDAYNHGNDQIKLGGFTYSHQEVCDRLDKLTEEEIRTVIGYMSNYGKPIYSPHKFILAMLLRADTHPPVYWSSKANADMT